MNSEERSGSNEVRVALVLYGGVSLAVYENGVTRCFYDLVRKRGVFGLLLKLLDARATVDVIAGTSAGGINGLFLAAALESGAEFAPTADLWRELGDLGALFCDVSEADNVSSLLDGAGYYQEKLIEAFDKICQPQDSYESPDEIDVFITGTDFGGHARRYRDSLGNSIEDKDHRVVFHLQHRRSRKSLGVNRQKSDVDVSEQAAILGSVARITSSFPVAFPPFRVAQLSSAAEEPQSKRERVVTDALARASHLERDGIPNRSFVDGGVLDNKPFGPVLNAISYRMPDKPVDRRLFYVEPDPDPFVDPAVRNDTRPLPSPVPLKVGLSCLTTVPSHEGIASDLEKLREHNQRVQWLKTLKANVRESCAKNPQERPESLEIYLGARIESLTRALVLENFAVPSAQDYPSNADREQLLDLTREELKGRVDGAPELLDPFDPNFQLRRAFLLLYEVSSEFARTRAARLERALLLIGQIIKALKIVREMMIVFRDKALETLPGDRAQVALLMDSFMEFVAEDALHWQALGLTESFEIIDTPDAHREKEFLNSKRLSTVVDATRKTIRETARQGSVNRNATGRTVFSALESMLERIIEICDGKPDRFHLSTRIDEKLFPMQFVSGTYEMDEIQVVRISPVDAQIGLSEGKADDKVAGDKLAHFSAFLRRDWRTNDILYGRFDGICQITQSLLNAEAMERVLPQASSFQELFDPENLKALKDRLRKCPDRNLVELCQRWRQLVAVWAAKSSTDEWKASFKAATIDFRDQLIVAAQQDAFHSDFEGIYADNCYQGIAYGQRTGPAGTHAGSDETAIEDDAQQLASRGLQALPPSERWDRFKAMKLGSQPISGPGGGVPNDVVGEYATTAYLLLWGMIARSMGGRVRSFLKVGRVRFFFRTPIAFFRYMFYLLRRDRTTALTLRAAACGALVGGAVIAWYHDHLFTVVACALLLFLLMSLFSPQTTYRRILASFFSTCGLRGERSMATQGSLEGTRGAAAGGLIRRWKRRKPWQK